jgi:hypothetical protein
MVPFTGTSPVADVYRCFSVGCDHWEVGGPGCTAMEAPRAEPDWLRYTVPCPLYVSYPGPKHPQEAFISPAAESRVAGPVVPVSPPMPVEIRQLTLF